jgi:hypothetical protein
MEKWATEAREAEKEADGVIDSDDERSDEEESQAAPTHRVRSWKKMTLDVLFGEKEQPRRTLPDELVLREHLLMEALADELEDSIPDDGAIECADEDVWMP